MKKIINVIFSVIFSVLIISTIIKFTVGFKQLYYFDIEYLFTVERSEIYPVPNVDSAIIKLVKKKNNAECDYNKFKKIVNDAFKQKRKNLRNNFKGYDLDKISTVLEKYNFDLTNRAEDLSYEIFSEISNIL